MRPSAYVAREQGLSLEIVFIPIILLYTYVIELFNLFVVQRDNGSKGRPSIYLCVYTFNSESNILELSEA